jgi:hypothetical protein
VIKFEKGFQFIILADGPILFFSFKVVDPSFLKKLYRCFKLVNCLTFIIILVLFLLLHKIFMLTFDNFEFLIAFAMYMNINKYIEFESKLN